MLTKQDIIAALNDLGLPEGALVIVHASLSSLGRVEGGAGAVAEALLEAVGPEGTVVVPTFAHPPGTTFDPDETPSMLGAVVEAIRKRPDACRSDSPLASIAAVGPEAAELCTGHDTTQTAHAEGTPYLRIAEKGGYVLLLGVDQDRNTMLHTAEELVRASYLTTWTAQMRKDGMLTEVAYDFFPGPHRDFIGLDRRLREQGVVKVGRIGPSVVRLMRGKELVDAVVAMLREDRAAVLCDNPACADCVAQRAAIRRDRIAKERFALSAQSQLAGRYPEEIADRLARAGVAAVEIDRVKGVDVASLADTDRSALKAALDAAEITVSGVRFRAAPADPAKAMAACKEVGAKSVILPASVDPSLAETAQRAGLKPLLENVAMTPAEVGARLQAASKADPGCAFNPAAFAAAGVKPFLQAYKRPVRKHVAQLYVNDGLFDGRPADLARGNAEIKEMVSILRCGSFDGPMVLTGAPGTLGERVDQFMALLESL